MEENQNYWNFGLVRLLLDFSLNTTIKVYSWQKWCNPKKGKDKLFTLSFAASTRGSLIALLLLSIFHHHTTHDGYLWIKCINNSISNCLCNNLDRMQISMILILMQSSNNSSFISNPSFIFSIVLYLFYFHFEGQCLNAGECTIGRLSSSSFAK